MGKVDAKRRNPKNLSPQIRECRASCFINTTITASLVAIPECQIYRVRAIELNLHHSSATAAFTLTAQIRSQNITDGSGAGALIATTGTYPTLYVTNDNTGVDQTYFSHVDSAKCWKSQQIPGNAASISRTADTNLQLTFSGGNIFSTIALPNALQVPTANQEIAPRFTLTFTVGSATAVLLIANMRVLYEPLFYGDDFDAIL